MFAKGFRKTVGKQNRSYFSSLVIAEQFEGKASENVRNVIKAASAFGEEIHVLLHGKNPAEQQKFVEKISGVKKVILAKNDQLEHPVASDLAHVAIKALKAGGYKRVMTPATNFGKDFISRMAGSVDSQPITDVIKIESENVFHRPVYAGNAISVVESSDACKLITIRPTNFEAAEDGAEVAKSEELDVSDCVGKVDAKWVENIVQKSDRPELTSAKIIISGGRGMKSGENFSLLYKLADTLGGAAVGASRAAVDAGFVPNELQVGQTGKVVAPNLYVAVGISGAIQHLAGMKDSKVIVAINKDPEAPIFEVANYGIVGDLFNIVPEMTEKLGKS